MYAEGGKGGRKKKAVKLWCREDGINVKGFATRGMVQ